MPSATPSARVLPSGLNATALICSAVPARAAVPWGVATSHNNTVPWLPAARVLPSGLNATELTEPVAKRTAIPGRAAAASMAWRAGLEEVRRPAATLHSLDKAGVAAPANLLLPGQRPDVPAA